MVFSDESKKLFVGRFLLPNEIEPWVISQNMGSLPAKMIFDHHTWSPTLDTWKGLSTLEAVFRYYERKGWPKGVGPHFFVVDTGVWIATHPRHDGIGVAGYNHRTIHIEIVGNFDKKPTSGKQLENLHILKGVLSKNPGISIDLKHNLFHRDKAAKTCPGSANTKKLLIKTAFANQPIPAGKPASIANTVNKANKVIMISGANKAANTASRPDKPKKAITREEFANALMSKSIPAVFYGPKLKPHVVVTRHEARILVDRGYDLINKPKPDVILDGRPGDPLLNDELETVFDRLT